jgi:DNA-binding GntR family transcriptional regulator
VAEPRQADAAYDKIQRMIVLQELAPGTLVSESEIMARTDIGRTPVREALQRLARDRMVTIYPNKGVLVPPLSIEAELKSLEVRRVLETLAVELACVRADDQDLEAVRELRTVISRQDFALVDYMDTVKDTHELIVSAAHNTYLADAMAPLQGLSRRFWMAHIRDAAHEIKVASDHHLAMLTAILDRDADQARQASLALNDYLVAFSLAAVRDPSN